MLTALIKLNMAVMGSQSLASAGHLTLRLSTPDGVQPPRDGSDPRGQLATRLLQTEAPKGMRHCLPPAAWSAPVAEEDSDMELPLQSVGSVLSGVRKSVSCGT